MPPYVWRKLIAFGLMLSCRGLGLFIESTNSRGITIPDIEDVANFLNMVSLTAAWAFCTLDFTFGLERFWIRAVRYWLCILLIWSIDCAAPPETTKTFDPATLLVAFATGTQGAFWTIRYFLGFKLVMLHAEVAHEQWTIRDFALGAALVGAALAMSAPAFDEEAVLSSMSFCLSVPLVFILPMAVCALRWRRWLIASSLCLSVLSGLCACLLAIRDPRLWAWTWELGAFFVPAILGPILGALALRWAGLRLIWRKEKRWPFAEPPSELIQLESRRT